MTTQERPEMPDAAEVQYRPALRRRFIAGVVLFVGISLFAYTKLWSRSYMPHENTKVRIGEVMPPVNVADNAGRLVDITKRDRESKRVIVFYSPSCHVCQEELPELRPFPPNVHLTLISEAREKDEAPVVETANLFKDVNHVLYQSLPMAGIPAMLFVDEHNVLRDGLMGAHSRDVVQKRLWNFAQMK